MGLIGAVSGGMNIAQGIRDWGQQSDAREFIEKNPDIYTDPELQRELMTISPKYGNMVIQQAPTVSAQRMQRASDGASAAVQSLDSAQRAYDKYLVDNPGDETTGQMPNYKAAEKAGNDTYQQHLAFFGERLGKGLAEKYLPPVWNLKTHADTYPDLSSVVEGMREPSSWVMPDGTVESRSFLPAELSKFLKDNPSVRPASAIKGGFEMLSPAQAEQMGLNESFRWGQIPGKAPAPVGPGDYMMMTEADRVKRQLPPGDYSISPQGKPELIGRQGFTVDTQGDHRKAFVAVSKPWMTTQTAYTTAKDALKNKTRAGDVTVLVKWAQIDNPSMGISEGSLHTMGQAQTLTPKMQGYFNMLQGKDGLLTDTARADISHILDQSYERYREEHETMRAAYTGVESKQGWTPGVITGGVPFMSDEEWDKLKAPLPTTAPGGPVPVPTPEEGAQISAELKRAYESKDFSKLTPPLLSRWFAENKETATKAEIAAWRRQAKLLNPGGG